MGVLGRRWGRCYLLLPLVSAGISRGMNAVPPELLTSSGVARLLGVHPKHVYRLLKRGLPALRIGGEWRFEREAVLAWGRGRSGAAASSSVVPPSALLAANDDEAVSVLLDELAASGGPLVGFVRADSGTALSFLEQGRVLVAGFHRREVPSRAAGRRLAHIHLVKREVGLVGRRGRAAPRLSAAAERPLASRPSSAGTRSLLDGALLKAGFDPVVVHARAKTLASHRDVICAVDRGEAEVGVTSRDWASRAGLPFRPLGVESYELLVAADDLGHPALVRLLESAQSRALRRRLGRLDGHTSAGSGALRLDPSEPARA
jgi:putative molybdopterin biosynthesis protein